MAGARKGAAARDGMRPWWTAGRGRRNRADWIDLACIFLQVMENGKLLSQCNHHWILVREPGDETEVRSDQSMISNVSVAGARDAIRRGSRGTVMSRAGPEVGGLFPAGAVTG